MCVRRARSARGKARFKAPSSSREGLGWGLSIARKADTLPAATSEQARKSRCPSRKREGSHFYSPLRSEEHTSELQSLMRFSYAVFCLKKKTTSPYTHISSIR